MSDSESSARQRIIETALRLFYQQGYRATGVNQIIAESGVAKATFYSHFPSKEKLCVAYLRARHGVWMGWLEKSVGRHGSPRGRVLGIFDFIREWMSGCEFRGCAFINIASEIPDLESEARREVELHKDSLRDFIRGLLLEARDSGEALPDANVDQLADMVYVLVEGAIVGSQNYGHVWPVDSARRAAAGILNL